MCVCVCVCECVSMSVCVCMYVCMYVHGMPVFITNLLATQYTHTLCT